MPGKASRQRHDRVHQAIRRAKMKAGTAPTNSRECREILYHEAGDRRCHWCGRFLSLTKSTLEHIIPLGRGGKHNWDNLTLVCKDCNR